MARQVRPAIDRALEPRHGVSRDGQPLSYNRAPAADLAPWIARLYFTAVKAPTDYRLECGLFNDTAFIRMQLAGDWTAETGDGPRALSRAALFFGPHSRRMPITVTGSFVSLGVSLRPGACHALKGPKVADFVDRLAEFSDLGFATPGFLDLVDAQCDPEDAFAAIEGLLREQVVRINASEPDPLTARFEALAFANPSTGIGEFAAECGVDQRRLERLVRRDFGMAPKQVLRRARALDMASHLRGVADAAEADELALRYYDQSHLIHEFAELFGVSPRQFVATPQPILTLALESRQARRLEAIARLAPGAKRPWE
jgi:AraC-like DNA-binding protein